MLTLGTGYRMKSLRGLLGLFLLAGLALSDELVTSPRGAVNGVAFQLGPGTVARGGILAVVGEGLAGAHTVAEEMPLPTSLGDPAVEVLINGVAAPLFFVSPTQVNAQVPWEVEAGMAEVVLRHDGVDSAAMPVVVTEISLNLIRHERSSAPIAQGVPDPADPAAAPAADSVTLQLGEPGSPPSATGQILDPQADVTPGATISVFAAGVGPTEPPVPTGSVAADGEQYALVPPQRVHVGGMPVTSPTVEVSDESVGIYKLTFTVPANAESTETFRWTSGGQGTNAVLGPIGTPQARYMSLPDDVGLVARIDMTDLNPYFVAVSEVFDDEEVCYPGAHLLDLRRNTTTAVTDCILPSYPNAANPLTAYRPFELARDSSALAALIAPAEDEEGDGITNRLLVVDGSDGTTETLTLDRWVDRLQPYPPGRPTLRLEHAGGTGGGDVIDVQGSLVEEVGFALPLPNPLEVDGLGRLVAQSSINLQGGFRVRLLGPESPEEIASSKVILFDRTAGVIAQSDLPDGWAPIAPPRRTNPQGIPAGPQSLAPTAPGFFGDRSGYAIVRKTDGSQDGVLAVRLEVAEDPEAGPPEFVSMTVDPIPFPEGTFAANCTTQVRWQRIAETRTLAIAGSDAPGGEFAEPRDGQICTSNRLVLFQPDSEEVDVVAVPEDSGPLDVAQKGSLRGYLYFGDGGREVALEVPRKLQVFEAMTRTFSEVAMPEGVGITVNGIVQQIGGRARLVALATGGPLRTNPRTGATQPQLPGNGGLVVVDLADETVTHLPLPDGYQRVIPGNFLLASQGRRGYGLLPLIGRAFATGRLRNIGPGQPGGSRIITWDLATGEPTEIEMPEGGFAAVRPVVAGGGGGGGGGLQLSYIWDVNFGAASIAFGVYDEGGSLISIGVVGP